MVVGEVQSGKTSNYIELICKAADAGYKFVVVLTGATNSLRAQTQLRFDEGFLGWDTRLNLTLGNSNKRVGVGTLVGEQLYRAIASTNAEETGDFNRKIANQFNVRLGGDLVIMVVKKNGSVLRNLSRWAKSLSPVAPEDPIPDIPTLVIDDEADFASVNTRLVEPGTMRTPLSSTDGYAGFSMPSKRAHTSVIRPHPLPTSSFTLIRMGPDTGGICSHAIS